MPQVFISDKALPTLGSEGDKEVNYTDNRLAGFILRVSAAGHQSFILRYSSPVTNKQRRWRIGSTDKMTATRAREKATSALEGLRRGH